MAHDKQPSKSNPSPHRLPLKSDQPSDPPQRRPGLLIAATGLMAIWATFLAVAVLSVVG